MQMGLLGPLSLKTSSLKAPTWWKPRGLNSIFKDCWNGKLKHPDWSKLVLDRNANGSNTAHLTRHSLSACSCFFSSSKDSGSRLTLFPHCHHLHHNKSTPPPSPLSHHHYPPSKASFHPRKKVSFFLYLMNTIHHWLDCHKKVKYGWIRRLSSDVPAVGFEECFERCLC